VGFWLSGLFGFWQPAGRYQVGGTAASTFWGSYAFLVGSYLQLLEAVNKHQESLSPSAWLAWFFGAPDAEAWRALPRR
jgi:hypothetical protein